MRHLLLAVILVMSAVGCVPLSYTFTPSSNQPTQAKAKGCKFEVHSGQPNEGYEEIGVLAHYNGDPPKDVEKLKSAISDQVCDLGGDAVIAGRDDKGAYTKATVIRYVQHAEPVKPLTDMPATQSSDAELPTKK